jgi:hypothetical protein
VDETGWKEQGPPPRIAVPGQRYIETLPDHAIEDCAESGPRVQPAMEARYLGRPLPQLEEAQGGDEENAAGYRACSRHRDGRFGAHRYSAVKVAGPKRSYVFVLTSVAWGGEKGPLSSRVHPTIVPPAVSSMNHTAPAVSEIFLSGATPWPVRRGAAPLRSDSGSMGSRQFGRRSLQCLIGPHQKRRTWCGDRAGAPYPQGWKKPFGFRGLERERAKGLGYIEDLNHVLRSALNLAIHGVPTATELRPHIPVVVRYIDDGGRKFETVCEIEWDCDLNDGSVVHGQVRRAKEPSRFMEWFRRVRRQLAKRIAGPPTS